MAAIKEAMITIEELIELKIDPMDYHAVKKHLTTDHWIMQRLNEEKWKAFVSDYMKNRIEDAE